MILQEEQVHTCDFKFYLHIRQSVFLPTGIKISFIWTDTRILRVFYTLMMCFVNSIINVPSAITPTQLKGTLSYG